MNLKIIKKATKITAEPPFLYSPLTLNFFKHFKVNGRYFKYIIGPILDLKFCFSK
jgi:hypothetical protein